MLSLDKRTVTLDHVSFFTERHGEEPVQGIALKFSFDSSNDILDEFAPGLKAAMYRAPEAKDAQQLFEEPTHLPLLRWPLVPSMKWDLVMTGRETIIAFGLGGDSDIRFAEATADKFQFTFRQGGSVGITFRVKAHPDGEQVSRLFELMGHEADIAIGISSGQQHSLESGADDEDGDDDAPPDLVDALTPDKPKRGRKGKVFAGALDGGSDDPFGSGEDEQP